MSVYAEHLDMTQRTNFPRYKPSAMSRQPRRSLLSLLGSGTAALLAGCQTDSPTETPSNTETETETAADCTAVPRPEAAWPVPRRSPARDSYVADPDGFETAPASVWEATPSAPDDDTAAPEYGQPVVAGNCVYVTNELHKGPQRPIYGRVHALDAATGDRQWSSERLRSPSHPVVWKDMVVVVAETEELTTVVVAFDRKDGTRRWTQEFTGRRRRFVAAGDHLYLTVEEDTDRGTVTALTDDGSSVWSRESAFTDRVNEGPAVGTDTVYVASGNGRLHALARDDGTTTWTHRFEHETVQRPYATDLVATTCSVIAVVEGMIKAINDDGTMAWEASGDHGTLVTDGETLYSTNLADDTRELQARDAATGEIRWTAGRQVPAFVAPDNIYVYADGALVALDRDTRTERWRVDGPIDDVAMAAGTLYSIDQGTLFALR